MSTTIPQNMTLATALNFAGMGIPVLPLKPGEKEPLMDGGFNAASTDTDTITKWFTDNPAAGLGAKPPEELPDGTQFLVLDADDAESFVWLKAMFGEPSVLTAGHFAGDHPGGGHWYVILAKPISGLRKNTLTAHTGRRIDIIGAQPSYIVAPPTRVAGKADPYRWQHREDPFISISTDHPLYLELVTYVADDAEKHRQEAEKRAAAAAARIANGITNESLDEWQRDTNLADRLARAGWTFHRVSSCRCGECEDWTHPFGASSKKSATLHVEGCAESGSGFPGGCLHLWSDNLPHRFNDHKSLSTFDFVAWTDYDGDYAECRRGEGIPDEENWHDSQLKGMSFDPSEADIDTDTVTPLVPVKDGEDTADEPAPNRELTFLPQDPNSKVTGRVLADGWIYDAVTALDCGWDTPVPYKEDGTVDKSFSPWDRDRFPKGHPCAPDLLNRVFNFNDFTRTVFHNARANTPVPTGPFALLGMELIRGIQRINPAFMPSDGTPASLAVIRVGDSGKGKSVSMKAGKWTNISASPQFGNSREEQDETHRLGSGQVLVNLMSEEVAKPDPKDPQRTIKERKQKTPCRVWLEDGEYRSVLKRAKNETSTIFDSLNEAWAGEHPGTATVTNGWIPLPEPFNVNISGGLQPKVWNLLKEQTTGFLQRVLMVAVSDPWRTLPGDIVCDAPPNAPVNPVGYATSIPVPPIPVAAESSGRFTLPPQAHAAVKHAQELAAFEHTESDDEWESHIVQTRIRIACAMAIRCGTTIVSPDIWEWSGWVIEHHRRVLAWIQKASDWTMQKERKDMASGMALADAERDAAKRRGIQNAACKILEAFEKAGTQTITKRDARISAKAFVAFLDAAVNLLIKDGIITVAKGRRKDSQLLTLVPGSSARASDYAAD